MDSPGRGGRLIVAGLPIAWLLVFFLLPFGLVLKISFSEKVTARPPYSPAFSGEESLATWAGKLASFGLDNYRLLLDEPLYVDAFLTSLRLALTATIAAADHRLSHRLWNGAGSGPGAACAAASGHAAVLDQLPDPRLRLDRHPEAGGPAELRAARAGRDRRAAGDHEHRVGGADRARLFAICRSCSCHSTRRSIGSSRP